MMFTEERRKDNEEDIPLTRLYNSLRAGEIARRQFEERVFQHIFDNTRRYRIRFKNKEDSVDFICSLYPKISKAIDKYEMTGHTFDAYIAATVRYSFQSEYSREKAKIDIETACWKEQGHDIEMREKEREYNEDDFGGGGGGEGRIRKGIRNVKTKAGKKHALILLMKGYQLAGEREIKEAAEIAGVTEEYVYELIRRVREVREEAEMRIQKMRERIHTQYYRYLTYETRKRNYERGEKDYEEMKTRSEEARRRLNNIRIRLRRARQTASNRQIAKILEIPKGTVDSYLTSLRKRMTPTD
jgi:transposase